MASSQSCWEDDLHFDGREIFFQERQAHQTRDTKALRMVIYAELSRETGRRMALLRGERIKPLRI